jgi:hypothetical protein
MVSVHFRAMSPWSHPCLCVSILFSYLREYHLRSHRRSIQFRSSYLDGRCRPWHYNLRTFFSVPSFRSSWAKKIWVMKPNTSRVMKHHLILQGAMSPTPKGKVAWMTEKFSLLSIVPVSFLLPSQYIFHHFLYPSLVNLEMRFLLRGRAVTPCVKAALITVNRRLNHPTNLWLIKF